MHIPDMFTSHRGYYKDRKRVFLLASLSFLLILGFGIICYDNDLLDTNDPPVIAFQYPVIIYLTHDEITYIQPTIESINLPLINKNSFLSRAPPILF